MIYCDIIPMPGPLTKDRDFLPKFRQSILYKLDISQNFNLHKNAFNIHNWQHAQYNFMQILINGLRPSNNSQTTTKQFKYQI